MLRRARGRARRRPGSGDGVYLHDSSEIKSQEVMVSLSKKQHDNGGRSFQVERN